MASQFYSVLVGNFLRKYEFEYDIISAFFVLGKWLAANFNIQECHPQRKPATEIRAISETFSLRLKGSKLLCICMIKYFQIVFFSERRILRSKHSENDGFLETLNLAADPRFLRILHSQNEGF